MAKVPHPPLVATLVDQQTGTDVRIEVHFAPNRISLAPVDRRFPIVHLKVRDGEVVAVVRESGDIHAARHGFGHVLREDADD